MKHFLQWLLGVISRKIAEDYANGKNGWDDAVEKRRITDGAKRVTV
jgi:hypothetical protein